MTHELLRASAGTGKTYRLVEAYADLVLHQGLRPSEIIGITFTRKAALELKLRIRDRLRRAGVAPSVLTELGRAPLSNFHGLALQMLRSWGPQAGFTPTTEVLGDSGADRALFVQACEDAWFGGTPEAAAAVQKLAPHVALDLQLPDALWEVIGRAREDDRAVESALVARYDAAAAQRAGHGQLLALRTQLAGASVTGKGKDKLAAFLAAPVPAEDAPMQAWSAAWRAACGHLDRRGTLGKVFSAEDQDMIAAALEGAAAEQVCAGLAPALALLLQEAWAAYGAAKAQRQGMDFADIIEQVVRVLSERPALHAGVRQRFRAVLVDEAQDTNRLQRRLIDLLAGLDGPAAALHPVAKLFVVGDWKQSIYTFRGADAQSFSQFADDLRARGGREETLSVSRRSTPGLVRSINHLGDALFGVHYEALQPLHPDDAAPAGCTWCVLDAPDTAVSAAWQEAQGLAARVRARLEEGACPGDFAVLMATMTTAPLVARALGDAGIPAILGGGGGLYEQSEVLDVLAWLQWICESRERLAAAIALRSPLGRVRDATLLQLAMRGNFGLESLWRGSLPELDGDADADRSTLQHIAARMPVWTHLARGDSAVALLEMLDADLQLRAITLAQPQGEQRLANVHRLFALARAAEGQPVRRFVRDQVMRVRQGHAEPMMPVPAAERRAVTISSVHQSKGLQYPVVVLAGVARKGRNDTAALRYSRQDGVVLRPRVGHDTVKTARWRAAASAETEGAEAELRRLLYVAVTRAERAVWIVAPEPETAGRDGFARFLAPWAAHAVAAGALTMSRQTPAPLPKWQPVQPAAAPLASLPPQAPAGTHFEISVTQLSQWDEAPVANTAAWRPRAPEAGALDPITRGSVAHAVLAAMERCPAAADIQAFITGELARAGHDPEHPALQEVRADLRAFLRSGLGAALLRLPAAARRPELPFALPVAADPYTACLRGKLDLLVWDEEGPLIIDYKHARQRDADLRPYFTQLEAYAWAVMQLCQVTTPVRTRLVFLRDHAAPPVHHLVTPEATQALQIRLQSWVLSQAAGPSWGGAAALQLAPGDGPLAAQNSA